MKNGKEESQGDFRVERYDSGTLRITSPPEFLITIQGGVEIALSILKVAGVETIKADPGQTVIRPPKLRKIGSGFM